MIDAHPALLAVSPQAPVTDYYLGVDNFHNGAFMLAANFRFYLGFTPREGDPARPPAPTPFDFGTPDGYDFFLRMGSLANADEKYFKHKNPYWIQNLDHTTYDDVWQSRSIWKYLKGIKPAVMVVGGWFDAEDLQGPLRTFEFMEKNSPPKTNMLAARRVRGYRCWWRNEVPPSEQRLDPGTRGRGLQRFERSTYCLARCVRFSKP